MLQAGSGTPRPIAGIEMEDVAVPVGTYPPKLNALSPGGLTSPPDTISSGQTNFAYNWAPWVCLGETIPVNVLPKLSYYDDFQRPNSSTLGANWAQRGDIHVTNGAATTTTKGVSSALWVYPLNYNNMSVRATCGTMTDFDYTLLVARGNNTFTRGIGLGINSVGFALVECVGVNQFEKIVGPIDRKFRTGDVVELQCIDDLYIVLHNGDEIYTWRDPATASQLAIVPVRGHEHVPQRPRHLLRRAARLAGPGSRRPARTPVAGLRRLPVPTRLPSEG
ncbi:hypothetical protein GS575_07175 [Rhodococcus hoagii]|nr:hypothetical protein [Prescottella equi]